MIDGTTATSVVSEAVLKPGFNLITDPNNLSFYEMLGMAFVIGIWVYWSFKFFSWTFKVAEAKKELRKAQKNLVALETKVKEAELLALNIKAGL
jgi:hypothetical protein